MSESMYDTEAQSCHTRCGMIRSNCLDINSYKLSESQEIPSRKEKITGFSFFLCEMITRTLKVYSISAGINHGFFCAYYLLLTLQPVSARLSEEDSTLSAYDPNYYNFSERVESALLVRTLRKTRLPDTVHQSNNCKRLAC